MRFSQWLIRLLSGSPHLVIGSVDNPYMLRWYIIPRNRWLNVYLHKFMRDDDDRALHDHPWWFVSLMLRGSYFEHNHSPGCVLHRGSPSIAFRRAEHRHRVELRKDKSGKPIPCWTLVVTGPKRRVWGFWCPQGFVQFQTYFDRNGCGDE